MADSVSRRSVIAGGLALAAAGPARVAAPASLARPPNILFIMADDLGFADLSCYGRRDFTTPAIDALAASGIRFTQAYANSAVCSATRTALITGRYQYRLPVGLEEPIAFRDVGLPPAHPTLPSLLRRRGYATALIGKWHLGPLPRFGPLQSGYEHFWGFRGGAVDYYTHANNFGSPDLWDGDTPVEQAGYLTDLLGDRAIAMLRGFAGQRRAFLLSLHFSAPHWPWEAEGDETESRRLAARHDVRALFDYDGGSQHIYAQMVQRLDLQVGRVLAELDRLGLARDTITVFTSDNGGERFSDTWPFTGRKTELLEGGLRIPAILRWPGRTPANATSEAQIMSMDWLPTLLAAAGATPAPDHPPDGIDIAQAIAGEALPERPLFWRYKAHEQAACRHGDWKYLRIAGNEFLFDVARDPMERANLKAREPDRFAALSGEWRRWNATMLPLDPLSYTHSYNGRDVADHFGIAPSPDD